jgi:hypothetical protein
MRTAQRRSKVAAIDPDWEASKAGRRNLNGQAAVQEVRSLQRQFEAQWSNHMGASPVDVNVIVKTLTKKRIPFVLTGAHGIAAWLGRPRNTRDIDILVKPGRNYVRAVNAIHALYPELAMHSHSRMTSFSLPGEQLSIIDVICPLRAEIEETLANPTWIEDETAGLRYRIPSLEEALANKYGVMLSPTRRLDKRTLDMADFTAMIVHSMDEGRQPIDMERLEMLGEKVWPEGGGEEICRLIEQVKAGRAIDLNSLG